MADAIGTLSNTLGYAPSTSGAASVPNIASASSAMVQTAVDLSATAGVIATLGASGTTVQTYDAAGLLNAIAHAGNASSTSIPVPPSGTDTQLQAQQQVNQGIVGTLPSDAASSGIYNSAGTVQNLSSDTSANWATILKSNPSLAENVIADSFTQGIVSSISVFA